MGVTITRFPDIWEFSLSIRVSVRVTINQFPENEDGKINFGRLGGATSKSGESGLNPWR